MSDSSGQVWAVEPRSADPVFWVWTRRGRRGDLIQESERYMFRSEAAARMRAAKMASEAARFPVGPDSLTEQALRGPLAQFSLDDKGEVQIHVDPAAQAPRPKSDLAHQVMDMLGIKSPSSVRGGVQYPASAGAGIENGERDDTVTLTQDALDTMMTNARRQGRLDAAKPDPFIERAATVMEPGGKAPVTRKELEAGQALLNRLPGGLYAKCVGCGKWGDASADNQWYTKADNGIEYIYCKECASG